MLKELNDKEQTTNDMEQVSDKERLVVLLLAWFLGILGIHRFYVKRKKSAIVMLLLSITIIGGIATTIWNITDMVYILIGEFRDGDGLKVKKWLS